jgi:hypothetical protein
MAEYGGAEGIIEKNDFQYSFIPLISPPAL